jgi:ammonium transporter, Amt family
MFTSLTGVVHLLGGVAALAASMVVGPRIGRFDNSYAESTFRGHSPALYILGTLMLWFGFFGEHEFFMNVLWVDLQTQAV